MANPKSQLVTNVSKNPLVLPDGRELGAGDSFDDYVEVDGQPLKESLFFKGGALVAGNDAKALADRLDATGADVEKLNAKVTELEAALSKETARANTAEAKVTEQEGQPAQIAQLNTDLAAANARAQKAEDELATAKKK